MKTITEIKKAVRHLEKTIPIERLIKEKIRRRLLIIFMDLK